MEAPPLNHGIVQKLLQEKFSRDLELAEKAVAVAISLAVRKSVINIHIDGQLPLDYSQEDVERVQTIEVAIIRDCIDSMNEETLCKMVELCAGQKKVRLLINEICNMLTTQLIAARRMAGIEKKFQPLKPKMASVNKRF